MKNIALLFVLLFSMTIHAYELADLNSDGTYEKIALLRNGPMLELRITYADGRQPQVIELSRTADVDVLKSTMEIDDLNHDGFDDIYVGWAENDGYYRSHFYINDKKGNFKVAKY